MHQTPDFPRAQAVPVWRDPAEARTMIRNHIDTFVDGTLLGLLGSRPAPALALAVSAGLGKTQTALEVLAERGRDLLEHGHVLFYVPTLDLAEEAAGKFALLSSGVPYSVLRGRLANDPEAAPTVDPEEKTRMCLRYGLVEQLSGVVESVSRSICQDLRAPGDYFRSECSRTCGYMRQLRQDGHRLIFLSHAYLSVNLPIACPIALKVIDEKFWPSLLSPHSIFVDDWVEPPKPGLGSRLEALHSGARMGLLTALEDGKPLLVTLRSMNITADCLRALADHERMHIPSLTLRPWDSWRTQEFLTRTFDKKAQSVGRMRAAVFQHLADNFGRPTTECLTLASLRTSAGERSAIHLHGRKELPHEEAMLFLDADADESILRQLRPDTQVVRIESKPQADVVQITDATMATSYLLDREQGSRRRSPILDVIRQEVERSGKSGCLVVATKDVLRALHEDAGRPVSRDDDRDLLQPLLGATPRWFGPRMLGVNDYVETSTIILIGRLQPPVGTLEENLRCLFGNGTAPLQFASDGKLSKADTVRLMSDDRLLPAVYQSHPDPAGALILEQVRERASLQAVARLRLISPRRPKRVILLSNLPLPGLPISTLTNLRALLAGCEKDQDAAAFQRLGDALGSSTRPTVGGLRLSAGGLREDLPAVFAAETSAKTFRRGRTTDWLQGIVERVAESRGWPCLRVDLAAPSGGRPIPAVVFADREEAGPKAKVLWPDLRLRQAF